MSFPTFADTIAEIRDVTGKEPRSVGGSLYVNRVLTFAEMRELDRRLGPPRIKKIHAWNSQTKIDL